jgi:hypothetical protein
MVEISERDKPIWVISKKREKVRILGQKHEIQLDQNRLKLFGVN